MPSSQSALVKIGRRSGRPTAVPMREVALRVVESGEAGLEFQPKRLRERSDGRESTPSRGRRPDDRLRDYMEEHASRQGRVGGASGWQVSSLQFSRRVYAPNAPPCLPAA